jgi:hypothetical protein
MTVEEYVEMTYLYKRWQLLDKRFDCSSGEFPDVEVALKEVEDIDALMDSLRSIHKVYGAQ